MGAVVTIVEKILRSRTNSTDRLLLSAYEQVFSKLLPVSVIKELKISELFILTLLDFHAYVLKLQ